MASVVIDGLVLPVSVAGHPALDFCNTRAGWVGENPKEYLHSHAHLCVWARENGLVEPSALPILRRAAARDPAAAAAVVARAVALRSSLYACLLGTGSTRHWAAVNREVRRAAAASTLAVTRGGELPAVWRIVNQSEVESPLLAVAWSAARLLSSPMAAQVAVCPGTGCGWVFADPRGRRRWCSMAWCGNRDKVRRHAARARARAAGSL